MEKEKDAVLLSKEDLDKLDFAQTRFRVLGEIIHNLFKCCFSDKAMTFIDEEWSMRDWFIDNYDLTSGVLWEASCTIEEQCDIAESILTHLNKVE